MKFWGTTCIIKHGPEANCGGEALVISYRKCREDLERTFIDSHEE